MITHIDIGFTGTQVGPTDSQIAATTRTFVELGMTRLHHGSCIGADAWAHYLARVMGSAVELHPPSITSKMARCEMLSGEVTHRPRPYLDRNHDIVDCSLSLVANPKEEEAEELRSGTWATVRYARRLGRPVRIVRPSGRVDLEPGVEAYLATTELAQVEVIVLPRGLDCAILLNRVRMRSLYEPQTAEEDARRLVRANYGKISSWSRKIPPIARRNAGGVIELLGL